MAEAALKETVDETQDLTDGFSLVIDAMKLNGIDTIYGVPGIPITDLGRLAQAAGIRVLSFRHEQNAGYAAAIARLPDQEARRLPHRLRARLPQRPDGARPRHHQLLPDDPGLGFVGARDRRPAAGRLRGDGPARHRQALCKAAYRVLHAQDIGIGLARAIRAAVSGRPGGVYLDLPAKLFAQVINADVGAKSLVKVVDAAPAQFPARPRSSAPLDVLKAAKRPLIILGKGGRLRPSRRRDQGAGGEERRALPADEHGQGPVVGHASAVAPVRRSTVLKDSGRRHADRRQAQLAAFTRQGQDLGDAPKRFIHVDIEPREMDSNVEIAAPVVGDMAPASRPCSTAWVAAGRRRPPTGPARSRRSATRTSPRWRRAS